jgi:putative hydrolases of HD superfamily
MTEPDAAALVNLLYEVGHLKRIPRTGWLRAGVDRPESVAEHSHRTAVIAYFIAIAEGANPDRAAAIALVHDLPETRSGDLDYVQRLYVSAQHDEGIAKDQARDLPADMAEALLGLIRQHADNDSPEAACTRDADKLECLLQARQYVKEHPDAQGWVDSMAPLIKTKTGRVLAKIAMETDPGDWWRELGQLYIASSRRATG